MNYKERSRSLGENLLAQIPSLSIITMEELSPLNQNLPAWSSASFKAMCACIGGPEPGHGAARLQVLGAPKCAFLPTPTPGPSMPSSGVNPIVATVAASREEAQSWWEQG